MRGDYTVYTDLDNHNYAEVLEMARADRKAAEGWRFRHHRGAASRALSVAWVGLKELLGAVHRIEVPAISPTRQRLSY